MKTPTCVDPGAVQDWELDAYASGEDLPHVAEHLKRCPSCRKQVAERRNLEHFLGQTLYRYDCPSPEQLHLYYWGQVPVDERADIERHLKTCSHCASELAEMTAFVAASQAEPTHTLMDRARKLAEKAKLTVAHLVAPILQPMPVLRGETREVLLFEAGDAALSLNLEQGDTGFYTLFGQLLSEFADPEKAHARLRKSGAGHAIVEASLNANGSFVLSGLPPGIYQLVVDVPDLHIVVPNLTLKNIT